MDPAHLLRSLAQLEQAYEANSGQADQLLDELISYLRRSLAGIQASASGSFNGAGA